MKIVNGWPPNIERIRAAFDLTGVDAVFTYGDTLYNPTKYPVDPALMAHEETHTKQQAEAGGPDAWWGRFIAEPEFRAEQEIAAYREQLRATKRLIKDRNVVARQVYLWAAALAGEMYGKCLSHAEATHRIKKGIIL